MRKYLSKVISFVKEMLSEDGVPSSKRCVAWVIMIATLVMTIICICKEGMTENNKDIIELFIGSACLLLGISKVADIFTKK